MNLQSHNKANIGILVIGLIYMYTIQRRKPTVSLSESGVEEPLSVEIPESLDVLEPNGIKSPLVTIQITVCCISNVMVHDLDL